MKKLFIFLVSLVITTALMTTFTACGSDEPDAPETPKTPTLSLTQGGDVTINANAQSASKVVVSNLDASKIKVASNAEWCSVELIKEQNTNYSLTMTASENISDVERTAVVTINTTDGSDLSASFRLKQQAANLTLEKTAVGFDKNSATRTIKVTSNNTWIAESNESWCTIERNGDYLTLRISAAKQNRQATITFKERKDKIVVNQTKYAVGEAYNENGVTGTVAYIGDDKRFIYRLATTEPVRWSTNGDRINAIDANDGEVNTNVVKSQSSWRSSFPAFAKVDELNIGGVTGWYMPAINELDQMIPMLDTNLKNRYGRISVHSSTEGGGGFMDCCQVMIYKNSSWERYTELKTSYECFTYAIHKF